MQELFLFYLPKGKIWVQMYFNQYFVTKNSEMVLRNHIQGFVQTYVIVSKVNCWFKMERNKTKQHRDHLYFVFLDKKLLKCLPCERDNDKAFNFWAGTAYF